MLKKLWNEKRWLVLFAVSAFAVLVTTTVLFAYGSVNDLSFAIDMYNPDSMFGRILAGFGAAPIFLGVVVVGTLTYLAARPFGWKIRIPLSIGAILLVVLGTYFFMTNITRYRSGIPMSVAIGAGFILSLLTVAICTLFFRNVNSRRLFLAVELILFTIVLEYAFSEISKNIWQRPRPYLLFEINDLSYFVPWYRPGVGASYKEIIDPSSVLSPSGFSDYFKSFPSGHTGHAALAAPILTILLAIKPKSRNYAWIGFLVGSLYAFVVAISRTVIGAHFLTDTMAGLSITLFSFVLVMGVYLIIKKIRGRNKPSLE